MHMTLLCLTGCRGDDGEETGPTVEGEDQNLEPAPPRKRARTANDSAGLAWGGEEGGSMLNGDGEHDQAGAGMILSTTGVPTGLGPHVRHDAPYPAVKRDDYVRLLIQALYDLGFQYGLPEGPIANDGRVLTVDALDRQSAGLLVKESGMCLQSESVNRFCEGVLRGDWKAVENLLTELHVVDDDMIVRPPSFFFVACSFIDFLLTFSRPAACEIPHLRAEISGTARARANVGGPRVFAKGADATATRFSTYPETDWPYGDQP